MSIREKQSWLENITAQMTIGPRGLHSYPLYTVSTYADVLLDQAIWENQSMHQCWTAWFTHYEHRKWPYSYEAIYPSTSMPQRGLSDWWDKPRHHRQNRFLKNDLRRRVRWQWVSRQFKGARSAVVHYSQKTCGWSYGTRPVYRVIHGKETEWFSTLETRQRGLGVVAGPQWTADDAWYREPMHLNGRVRRIHAWDVSMYRPAEATCSAGRCEYISTQICTTVG